MKKYYILNLILISILSIIYSAFGIFVLFFINKYILNLEKANSIVLLVFIILLFSFFIFSHIFKFVVANIGNKFIYELRTRFVLRVLNSTFMTIMDTTKAKILACVSKDINNISNGLMRISDLLQSGLLIFFCIFYFFYLSNIIAIFIVIWFLIMGFVVNIFIRKTYKNYKKSRQKDDVLYKDYETMIDAFKELSINKTRFDNFFENFCNNALSQKNSNIKAEISQNISSNFLNVMMLGGVGFIMYFSLTLNISDFKTATTICFAMLFLRTPFIIFISSIPSILLAKISFKKIKDMKLINFNDINFNSNYNKLKYNNIKLKNINFSYMDKKILKNINLEIKKGETVFIIGKNGSGKSTLFLILCGILNPNSGDIWLDDMLLNNENLNRFQNTISAVFSDFYLFKNILNDGGIEFWSDILKIKDKVNIQQKTITTNNLSTGQKKRAALLENLAANKDFLMLDEFAADQDPEFREYFYTSILPLLKSKGISVFAISHDDKYFKMADKIYKMENGNLTRINI